VNDRGIGVAVILMALALGTLGKLANTADLVAYALIIWVGGLLLLSFGWKTGKHFWPPVLHLVYMLPLPAVIYFKTTTSLQLISSELGVWFLKVLSVPVFLEGNIIDLGVTRLHVAEACSGLRYMFPILSFSYIFAVLYRGPIWHKAVLLLSAVPITVLMNSVRIAVAGIIVNNYGASWLEGFTHFFEGWVIFICCIILLFLLARIMLFFNREKMSLVDALDLETDGLGAQAQRLALIQPSKALIGSTLVVLACVVAAQFAPAPAEQRVQRDPFVQFPRDLGEWEQTGPRRTLEPDIARVLAADDYHEVTLVKGEDIPSVGLFMAWYYDQQDDGVHSPEVCLPGAGWEIAWLERTDIADELGASAPFEINRAIIQKGETQMMVYYWFKQNDRQLAWDIAAKFWLTVDTIRSGRADGGIIRLTTLIGADETEAQAEARLKEVLIEIQTPLPRFMPGSG
jgi:exosortase D (VPLPA-CTERM-specific)